MKEKVTKAQASFAQQRHQTSGHHTNAPRRSCKLLINTGRNVKMACHVPGVNYTGPVLYPCAHPLIHSKVLTL